MWTWHNVCVCVCVSPSAMWDVRIGLRQQLPLSVEPSHRFLTLLILHIICSFFFFQWVFGDEMYSVGWVLVKRWKLCLRSSSASWWIQSQSELYEILFNFFFVCMKLMRGVFLFHGWHIHLVINNNPVLDQTYNFVGMTGFSPSIVTVKLLPKAGKANQDGERHRPWRRLTWESSCCGWTRRFH